MPLSDEGKRLTHVRRANRGVFTRLVKKAKELFAEEEDVDLDAVHLCLDKLQAKLTYIESLDAEILGHTPDEDLEDAILDSEEQIYSCQEQLMQFQKSVDSLSAMRLEMKAEETQGAAEDVTKPLEAQSEVTKLLEAPQQTVSFDDRQRTRSPELHPLGPIDYDQSMLSRIWQPLSERSETGIIQGPMAPPYIGSLPQPLEERSEIGNMQGPVAPPVTSSLAASRPYTPKSFKLPKLNLPRFSGEILDWPSFEEEITNALDCNSSLSDIERFQILRGQLDGEASDVVKGLSLIAVNYRHAKELLKEAFGQPHIVIDAFMRALWELPRPTEDAASLRQFGNKIEVYIRGLRNLGKSETSYGELLIPVVLDKLPISIRMQITRSHASSVWTMNELREALKIEAQAMQAGVQLKSSTSSSYAPTTSAMYSEVKVNKKLDKSRNSEVKWKKQPDRFRETLCVFCHEKHYSSECPKVKDPVLRKQTVMSNKLCLNCFREGHFVRECKAKGRCRNCGRKHHTALCQSSEGTKTPTTATSQIPATDITVTPATAQISGPSTPKSSDHATNHVVYTPIIPKVGGPVLLKTATSLIESKNGNAVNVNILFDEGAQRTFITQRTVEQLGHTCQRKEDIMLSSFGADTTDSRCVEVADLQLKTRVGQLDISAFVVPRISTPAKNYLPSTMKSHLYLQELDLAHSIQADVFEIDLLIGADYYWSIVGDHIVRGPGPTAVSSSLGYLLSGPTGLDTKVHSTMVYDVMTAPADIQLENYWDLETIGIKHPDQATESSAQDLEEFQQKYLHKDGDQYCARLPWKEDHPTLPTNHGFTKKRTNHMISKLNLDIKRVYDSIIKDQLRQGFVEKIENDDPERGHYLPHHSVKKDSVTTPIRIVYDCSARSNSSNPSLNDCLHKGPTLLNDMIGILLRFRTQPIAVTSDITKAFLHVKLHEDDRDFTKFFWLKDIESDDLEVYRFASVLFGSASSPAILNAVIRVHLEEINDDISRKLKQNIYVDNVAISLPDVVSALTLYSSANSYFNSAGFQLRQWTSNDPTVREHLQQQGDETTFFGLRWNTSQDEFQLPVKDIDDDLPPTKRRISHTVSTIFDPSGFVTPVHIMGKIFLQQIWKMQLDWDEEIPPEEATAWRHILDELVKIPQIKIPRSYFPGKSLTDSTIHCFVDASMKAYGAVIYVVNEHGSSLVMTKSRVAPIKELTLPRLELMAATIGARLTRFVCNHLKESNISQCILWSDSQIVLSWLASDKPLPTFVKNRVKEIRSAEFSEFKYCPTTENPADLLTRGMTVKELQKAKLWWHGPSWLSDESVHSPDPIQLLHIPCDISNSDPSELESSAHHPNIERVMDINKYSSAGKLFRVTAFVLRFINRLKGAQVEQALLIRKAEQLWIKSVQHTAYSKEISSIKLKKGRKECLARQLQLFLDEDDVLRKGGRLHNAPLPYGAKFPVLLPKVHHFTYLIIRQCHERVHHLGLSATVTNLRQNYWVTQARSTVSQFLRRCVICKRQAGRPYQYPVSPPLPTYRLEDSTPFTYTGIDFTGALFISRPDGSQGKVYICLFTCATTRAVHLEVVPDLTVKTFLNAFRRFAARRSLPTKIISDNATTYLSAAEEIKRLMEAEEVKTYFGNLQIEWVFIPKRAPWFGGFWERLIGITKNCLKKALGRSHISLDELQTIVTEIESTMNDRPITYVEEDCTMPLTPSLILHGHRLRSLPHEIDDGVDDDPDFNPTSHVALNNRHKRLTRILQNFKKSWSQEYLTSLQERHKVQGSLRNHIKIGDVVLIHDEGPRLYWRMAVVEDLQSGIDGLVRSAMVKTSTGVTNRPINKLYPLEVALVEKELSSDVSMESEEEAKSFDDRPGKRHAALTAGQRIKSLRDQQLI